MIKANVPDRNQDSSIIVACGAPYGGPNEGKDAHGQFFDDKTNFLEHIIPFPPAFHFHGAKLGALPYPIGETIDRWTDNKGVWYKIRLFTNHAEKGIRETAKKLYEAAKAGALYTSSGAVQAAIQIDKATGHIAQWLIGEISLIDARDSGQAPANYYAVANVAEKSIIPRLVENGVVIGKEKEGKEKEGAAQTETTPRSRLEVVRDFCHTIIKSVIPGSDDSGDLDKESLAALLNTTHEKVFGEPLLLPFGTMEVTVPQKNPSSNSGPPDNTNGQNGKTGVSLEDRFAEMQSQMANLTQSINDREETIKSLQSTIENQQSVIQEQAVSMAARGHEAQVNEWIAKGLLTPGEKDSTMRLLSFAYAYDTQIKADEGEKTLLAALTEFIEARPPLQDISSKSANGRVGGILAPMTETPVPGLDNLSTDEEYLNRMRGMVDLPAKEGGY